MNEREFNRVNKESFGSPKVTHTTVETDGQSPQHNGVLRRFAGAILRGEPLVADGSEGINGLTISNAIHLSSWLDRTVTLPLDEELYYSELQKRVATSRLKPEGVSVVADTSKTYNSK